MVIEGQSDTQAMFAYSGLFRQYIVQAAEHVYQQVQVHAENLPDEIREKAWHVLSFALGWPDAWPTTRNLLMGLSEAMEYTGWGREWLPYLVRGIEQSRAVADQVSEAALCLKLGVLHRSLAQFPEARIWLTAAANHYQGLQDHANQAKALNRLAFLARLTGQYQEATQLVESALTLLANDAQERAVSCSILGALAFDQRAWERATGYFQQALTLHEKYQDKRLLAWAWEDLASACWAQEKYADAITNYKQALLLLREIKVPTQEAVTKMNLSALYLSTQQPQKALTLLTDAEPVLQKAQDETNLTYLYCNQGIAYGALGHWPFALHAFTKAIEYAQRHKRGELLVNALDELGLVYAAMHNFTAAAAAFQKTLDALSQISNEATRVYYQQTVNEHWQQTNKKRIDESNQTSIIV